MMQEGSFRRVTCSQRVGTVPEVICCITAYSKIRCDTNNIEMRATYSTHPSSRVMSGWENMSLAVY